MKNKTLIPIIALGAALVAFTGCKKSESTPAGEAAKETADKTAGQMQAGEAVKAAADKAVTGVKEQAQTSVDAAKGKAQDVIDKAKSLLSEGKAQEALSALGGLSGFQLTPDQEKLVAGLKEQIQKALTDKAATEGAAGVGNLIGGKK